MHKLLNCKSNGDKSQGLGVKHIIIDIVIFKIKKYMKDNLEALGFGLLMGLLFIIGLIL